MGSFPSFLSNECSSLWSMAARAKKWVTYLNGGGSQRQLRAAVLVFTILVVIQSGINLFTHEIISLRAKADVNCHIFQAPFENDIYREKNFYCSDCSRLRKNPFIVI